MSVRKLLFIALLMFILSTCWKNNVYKGYTETDTGLYYKLLAIGEGKKRPAAGDYLQLRITYKTEKDSVFLDTYTCNETGMVILPYEHSSFVGSFEEGLTKMNEDDSVSFIVNADSLFSKFFKAELPWFLKKEGIVKMDVKLNRILSKKEYEAEIERYHCLIENRDIEEQRKLNNYLDTINTNFSPLGNGLYYAPVKQGSGELAENGDIVKLQYTGYFLDGRQFESSFKRGQPLEYTVGQQGQVIRGLEMAINLLNEGAKAKFIIPSQLAFGETGSSTGIVPPYSTLVYEVELLSLTKNN